MSSADHLSCARYHCDVLQSVSWSITISIPSAYTVFTPAIVPPISWNFDFSHSNKSCHQHTNVTELSISHLQKITFLVHNILRHLLFFSSHYRIISKKKKSLYFFVPIPPLHFHRRQSIPTQPLYLPWPRSPMASMCPKPMAKSHFLSHLSVEFENSWSFSFMTHSQTSRLPGHALWLLLLLQGSLFLSKLCWVLFISITSKVTQASVLRLLATLTP